jgi:hypothetical protein
VIAWIKKIPMNRISPSLGTKESEFKKGGTRRSNIQPGSSKRKFIGRNVSSPPPVEGRVHMNMQTDDFLEELTDRYEFHSVHII